MDNELLTQILQELHEIKSDIRWFKEREELKQRANWEIENPTLTNEQRARALVAFASRLENEK